MAISQARPLRKQTGARYKGFRKRKKHELGRNPAMPKLEKTSKRSIRVLGGNKKTFLLNCDTVNLTDRQKKSRKAKIKAVVENSANRNFIRRNILTKGTIVETELGKARITSRPGQEGGINAVLI